MAAKRSSAGFGGGMRLDSFSQLARPKAAGIYPAQRGGRAERGGIAFPSVIEAYNRDSDYKRWRLGSEYYFGVGRSWADFEQRSLTRLVGSSAGEESRILTTVFPSGTSAEAAWHVACRVRGSVILNQPLTSDRVSVNVLSSDPADHTLTLDMDGVWDQARLQRFEVCIGDQFEDSASGVTYPADLIEEPVGSVALTLIGVDPVGRTLTFDLSRQFARLEANGRIYWHQISYAPSGESPWALDGTRYLCSSFKFFCTCPDHSGGSIANLDTPQGEGSQRQFPLPAASRDGKLPDSPAGVARPLPPWEGQGAGYYKQWRTLLRRRDQRRDCKHIHAVRWSCGVPWYEPDDYPIGEAREFVEFAAEAERGFSVEELENYFRLRQLNRRYLIAVADASGINLYPPGDPRAGSRVDPRPMLWNDPVEPELAYCRASDWWIERGTRRLQIYNPIAGAFEDEVTVGGISYPVIEDLAPNQDGSVVIVP